MTLQLFGHPFSSYTQKALIALYENDMPFTFRMLDPEHPENGTEFARRWPVAKFPVLVDGDTTVVEATSIIEYLDTVHPGAVRFIPDDRRAALPVRHLDRVFDNYVMGGMQAIVNEALLPEARRDPERVVAAKRGLDTIYAWLDGELGGRASTAGDAFTLADCAAAPSLFYADWAHPIADAHANLKTYRARLLARPSVVRCVEQARPYRAFFPLGAPTATDPLGGPHVRRRPLIVHHPPD